MFLCDAFTQLDPERAKRTDKSTVTFCAFGTYMHKNCALNVDEIDPRLQKVVHSHRARSGPKCYDRYPDRSDKITDIFQTRDKRKESNAPFS